MLASVGGFQMLRFGQFWLVFELTGSPLALGYVGLANGIPAIFLNLFGGLAADRMDQRRLIIAAQGIVALLIFLLATVTLLDLVQVWHILVIAFLAGAVEAFDQPARRALLPHLVDRSVMMSAVALNSSIWPSTRIMAPAVAGFIIAGAGTAAALYVSGVGFLIMAVAAFTMRVPRVTRPASGGAVHDLLEGLGFICQNPVLIFLVAMTFFNSFFGMAYVTLMPVFAVDILKVGANGQGLLLGIGGVGSLITTIWLAARGDAGSKGLLIIGGSIMSGLSVAAFALTAQYVGSFALAMFLMAATSVFNTLSNTALQSTMQLITPDQIRGRVMGFYGMTYNIRPLGAVQAGAVAGVFGAPLAIAAGGFAVVLFTLGAPLLSRRVRRLDRALTEAEQEQLAANQEAGKSTTTADD
ncbi:MAG: MFS transporter, partial [Dehalococcoidia bacterium]